MVHEAAKRALEGSAKWTREGLYEVLAQEITAEYQPLVDAARDVLAKIKKGPIWTAETLADALRKVVGE